MMQQFDIYFALPVGVPCPPKYEIWLTLFPETPTKPVISTLFATSPEGFIIRRLTKARVLDLT